MRRRVRMDELFCHLSPGATIVDLDLLAAPRAMIHGPVLLDPRLTFSRGRSHSPVGSSSSEAKSHVAVSSNYAERREVLLNLQFSSWQRGAESRLLRWNGCCGRETLGSAETFPR